MSIANHALEVPGVAAGEGTTTGAVATELTGAEPWSGYDEQSVDSIATALRDTDDDTAAAVRTYERERRNRDGVIQAVDQRLAN